VPILPHPSGSKALLVRALAAGLTLVAVLRIVATYRVFSQSWDEPAHLAAGMEWLVEGRYTREPLHPPLARVAIALGPYLDGARSAGYVNTWQEGNALLDRDGHYQRNLTLARLGTLPFFLLAVLIVYLWASALAGSMAGVVAVLLFTTTPAVLGHAGLATTELAVTATVTAALWTTWRWLRAPTAMRGCLAGLAIASAVLSKLSALLFVPAGILGLWLCQRALRRQGQRPPALALGAVRATYLTMLVVIWAGYRFSIGPLLTMGPAQTATPAVELPAQHSTAVGRLAALPVFPAPEFFQGLSMLYHKNAAGQKAYLLGEVRTTGWWYFFPVAIAVKTPLAFLGLVAAALVLTCGRPQARGELAAPLVAAGLILLTCLPAHINIGLRHVLPMYPLLAIAGGVATVDLWRGAAGRPGLLLAAGLIFWQLIASYRAHPDYVAYFNELADRHPERVLVDSDLDNGMDLARLADTLRARGIERVWIAYAGSADLARHGLPPYRELPPRTRVNGWIVVSLYDLKLGAVDTPTHDEFSWLEAYHPITTIGRSIRLYHVTDVPEGPVP
jgi:hypothetical protein